VPEREPESLLAQERPLALSPELLLARLLALAHLLASRDPLYMHPC